MPTVCTNCNGQTIVWCDDSGCYINCPVCGGKGDV